VTRKRGKISSNFDKNLSIKGAKIMANPVNTVINTLLKPLGLRLVRTQTIEFLTAHQRATGNWEQILKELHHSFTTYAFPHVPYDERRNALLNNLMGTSKPEAFWILSGLYKSMGLVGDICEFGCAQGATTALMAHEIIKTDKHVWVYDSFEGLPQPTEKDKLIDDIFNLGSIEAYAGTMNVPIESVKNNLKGVNFPPERTHLIKGFIEETIKTGPLPHQVCFAYVDFDFYEPILVALNFLKDVLTVGGTIVVDDYGFFSAGAQAAVDEFLAVHGDHFKMELPPEWAGRFAVLQRVS